MSDGGHLAKPSVCDIPTGILPDVRCAIDEHPGALIVHRLEVPSMSNKCVILRMILPKALPNREGCLSPEPHVETNERRLEADAKLEADMPNSR
jgi:hypothetical protein